MEKKIEIHIMPNSKDTFSYYVKHPLMSQLFKKSKRNGRPIKRDDISYVLGRLAKRIITQINKGRKDN